MSFVTLELESETVTSEATSARGNRLSVLTRVIVIPVPIKLPFALIDHISDECQSGILQSPWRSSALCYSRRQSQSRMDQCGRKMPFHWSSIRTDEFKFGSVCCHSMTNLRDAMLSKATPQRQYRQLQDWQYQQLYSRLGILLTILSTISEKRLIFWTAEKTESFTVLYKQSSAEKVNQALGQLKPWPGQRQKLVRNNKEK